MDEVNDRFGDFYVTFGSLSGPVRTHGAGEKILHPCLPSFNLLVCSKYVNNNIIEHWKTTEKETVILQPALKSVEGGCSYRMPG